MPGTLDDIIVFAPVLTNGLNLGLLQFYNTIWSSLPYDRRTNPFEAGPYTLQVEDQTMLANGRDRTLAQGAMTAYIQRYAKLRLAVSNLSDSSIISASSFETFTKTEFLAKFDALSKLVVTNRSYLSGYTGANHGTSWEIDYRSLAGWNAQGESSTFLLILHEIGHNTLTGHANHDLNWNAHREANPGVSDANLRSSFIDGNPLFMTQETTANTIARNLAISIGVAVHPNPTYGYSDASF